MESNIVLKVVGGILVVCLVICGIGSLIGLRKAPADKIALSYGGGPFEGAEFQGITQPGSGIKFNGIFDKWYEYPVTQRNYVLTDDNTGDEKVGGIRAADKNGVSEYIQLTVNFKINTSKIRNFHEKIGLKYKAYGKDGWDKMLAENFRQPLEAVVQQKIRQYTTDEIRTGSTVLPDLTSAIELSLKDDIKKLLGDDYFCGPTYKVGSGECPNFTVSVKSITPPADIIQSYADQRTSENKVVVAKNNADAQVEKARGENASKDAVAPALTPDYLAYLRVQALQDCAKNSNCTLVVGGNEFNVNVR